MAIKNYGKKRTEITLYQDIIIECLPMKQVFITFTMNLGNNLHRKMSTIKLHRINQHFIGQNPKSKKIQLEVSAVSYEKIFKLVALLKESSEIKHQYPRNLICET